MANRVSLETDGIGAGLVWLIAAALAVSVSTPAAAEPSAQQLFDQGEFAEAKDEAYLHEDADSLRVRSRFALWSGDDERARRFAHAAVDRATDDDRGRRARIHLARLEWLFGERDDAIDRLRDVLADAPNDPEVRFELGRRLVEDGDVREGETILEGAVRRFEDGMFEEIDAQVWVGRALAAADRPRKAHEVLVRAVRRDEGHLEANLRLGQLLLDWHNTTEAVEAFERVLERQPDHPEALVGMATVEFYRSGRFAEAMNRLERALEHFPGHPEVQRARVELLIAQGRWNEGRRVAREFLERAGSDGRVLSLLAAVGRLQADDELFEEAARRFDERRSDRPDLLATAGRLAAMHNRHRGAIPLFEAALERDEGHRGALTGLGMALMRTGQEVRGLSVLRRAFDADSYDVTVYNTLELYDRGLDDVQTREVGPLRLRAPGERFDLVEAITGPLVEQARRQFRDRYGVELPSLTLEVYDDSEAFAVRSVGLPHVDPHGICFGPVVLTRGPADEEFNWPMVVWHELAHSYHLERSDERVPMWFTEGLAEYETRLHRGGWTRFRDLGVARRLQHDRLWSLADLDQVFLAGHPEDVPVAYQTAMLFMAYLDDRHGLEVAVEMLDRFAERPDTEAVLEEVLEGAIPEIDERFQTWLEHRYSGLLRQQLVDRARIRAMVADEEVDHAGGAEAAAYRALVAAMVGDEQRAGVQLDNLRRLDEGGSAAGVVAVVALGLLDRREEGLELGRRILGRGVESVELRGVMSDLAAREGRDEEALVHALAATELAPEHPEGWRRLERRAEAMGDQPVARRARAERFERAPHDAQLARDRTGFLFDNGDYDGARRAAERWTEVAAYDARAHIARGRAAVRLGNYEEADEAWRRAAMAAPARRVDVWETALEEFDRVGADDRVDEYRQRIRRDADENP